MSPSLSRNAATLCGLMAIVLWSTIVGLIRGVSEHFGAVGGAALIYTVGAILLALLLGRPRLRGFPRAYLLLGSLEYQHPVREGMSAAVFYDIGNAVDSVHDYRAVAGYGIGLRWRTPVGPINLDLAYGADVHKVRWHLSVGYTF